MCVRTGDPRVGDILVVGRNPRGRREGPPASALDSLIGRDKTPYFPHIILTM